MKKSFLKFLILLLVAGAGYFLGKRNSHPEEPLSRESRMANSIVMDSVYCRPSQNTTWNIRLALLDFLASGGKTPEKESCSHLLLVYLQNHSSEGEIKQFFKDQFDQVEAIYQENCLIKARESGVFMIAGPSPLISEDHFGESECGVAIDAIQSMFIDYVMSYDWRRE